MSQTHSPQDYGILGSVWQMIKLLYMYPLGCFVRSYGLLCCYDDGRRTWGHLKKIITIMQQMNSCLKEGCFLGSLHWSPILKFDRERVTGDRWVRGNGPPPSQHVPVCGSEPAGSLEYVCLKGAHWAVMSLEFTAHWTDNIAITYWLADSKTKPLV